jgi:hypothetical protein
MEQLSAEGTKARRHEGTKARRHEGTKARRHEENLKIFPLSLGERMRWGDMKHRDKRPSPPQWRLALFLLISIISQYAFAHSGRTNAAGCHNNRKTSEYHCHGGSSSSPRVESLKQAEEGCGPKYYCGEMTSCAEAMHYFRDCGLDRLDGDNDGVPCESICGHHK